MMILKSKRPGVTEARHNNIYLRCPVCLQKGTFTEIGVEDVVIEIEKDHVFSGQRRCPNIECMAIIFVVNKKHPYEVLFLHPSEKIIFDTANIPPPIVSALEEAISCHASQCYVASAIMVRKTLEELCRDRGATGGNLRARIQSLGTKVILPPELLDGMDDLRLLGNDAAHIESHEYDKVGKEESEIGIEFSKEVLKSVYQYADLLGRLRALKKATTPPTAPP